MNSDSSKSVRYTFSAEATRHVSTTVDPDAPGLSGEPVAFSGVEESVPSRAPENDLDSIDGAATFATSELIIGKLNEFLRGEISAVQAYNLALKSLKDHAVARELRDLRDSHDRRVGLLREWIRASGAIPVESSGAWGAFARFVQRGADLFGDAAALSALEEGEEHGLKLYMEDLDEIDAETHIFIRDHLLPDQRRTHDLCSSLRRYVKAA